MPSISTDRRFGINASVAIKAPCDLATTANITLSGEQSIDGTTTSDSRVFVKNQTTASANGIYRSDSGSWVREKDFNGNRDIVTGTLITVNGGTTNADTMWRVTNTGTITIDSTSLTFERAAVNDSNTVSFLQAGTGAVARTAQEKMRESVSVLDFGATGDGTTDDTAAIQLAIDSRKSLHWPPGEFIITDELTFPATTVPGGGWWKGGGMSRTNPQVSTRDGPTTTLIWDGAVGGTMISSAGLAGWAFEDMAFVGRPASGDANRAGILLHFKTNASFGTGHNEINRCSFWDADVCVQQGVATSDTDCDTTNLRQVIFGNSDRGFVNKHGQGLLHYFNQVFGLTCTTVIDFEQGGDIQCDSMNFNGCGGAGATDYAIRMQTMQTQSHTAIFNNLRVENGTVKVLEAKAYGKVILNAFTEGQVDQNSLMFYSEGAIIEFNASRFATFDATTPTFKMTQHAGGFRPAMVFRECTFEATTFTLAEWFTLTSTSLLGLRIENCTYKGNGTRLPYFNSVCEWGPVTHRTQTTDAVLKSVYLDGGAAAAAGNTLRIPANSFWMFDVYIIGKEVGGGGDVGSFHRRITIKDDAGTTTQIGSTLTIGTDENSDAWAVALNVQNAFIRAQVTGKVSTTIDWRVLFVPTCLITDVA